MRPFKRLLGGTKITLGLRNLSNLGIPMIGGAYLVSLYELQHFPIVTARKEGVQSFKGGECAAILETSTAAVVYWFNSSVEPSI